MAAVIRRRFPQTDSALEADLAACEEAARDESLQPRAALRLVQLLDDHLETLKEIAGEAVRLVKK